MASGVISGTAINGLVLPSNPLITEYNMDKGSLFKVYCKATYVEAPTLQGGPKGIGTYGNVPEDPIYFEAICNADTLTMSHEHRYDKLGGLMGVVADFMKSAVGTSYTEAARAGANLQQASAIELGTEWNTFAGWDISKAYQGTNPLTFELSLVLIAHKDPLLEVVLPAASLTYLSYPVTSKTNNTDNLMNLITTAVNACSTGEPKKEPKKDDKGNAISNLITDLVNDATGIVDKLRKFAEDQQFANRAKYKVGSPPPTWSIETSNGIVSMDSCHISNLSVVYHGPWISSPTAEEQLKDMSPKILTKLGVTSINGKVDFNNVDVSSFNDDQVANLDQLVALQRAGGYPSWAEIKIKFENNFHMLFGEEVIKGIITRGNTTGGTTK
jgi:hypothetical protein